MNRTYFANDPNRKSWISVEENSDFPIQNIPFGIARRKDNGKTHVSSIIGNQIIDLAKLQEMGVFEDIGIPEKVFEAQVLNDFIALGKTKTNAVRDRIAEVMDLSDQKWEMREKADVFLVGLDGVDLLLPVHVPDYTDFYSSEEHARNVGSMFRDPENALLPNWKHLPVGYHGRASSIVVSGTPVRRPKGQLKPNDGAPVYGPCRLLDFELEMAFVLGKGNALGEQISTAQARDHIFGMVLFNDWSARDIQKWEYVPLGPFLGKSFASTVSPWIVTIEALDPFRVSGPVQEPAVLSYLEYSGDCNYDIQLNVELETPDGEANTICRSNSKYLYWNVFQQLAHHTVNGCNMRIGDMCASGTISGKDANSYGSMLELSWRGTKPLQLSDGTERKFIQDGDAIHLSGYAQGAGYRVGFGRSSGKVLPAV